MFTQKYKYKFKVITALSIASLVTLSACTSVPEETVMIVNPTVNDEVYSFHTHQLVNGYTDRLAHDLFKNLRGRDITQSVVVTSFVNLDGTLQNTQKLGNLVSESLLGQVQAYEIPIIDIHLMGGVNITPTGDYAFSRDVSEILYSHKAGYILAGVLIKNERGFTVNARIMDLRTKNIVSAASTFIPTYVVDAI
ncbi:FlgO family outer membrane protein [Colwellia ponticola]|uniref:FlgO domain-containing protein n=1 Tax=Colwellia ponticola TaxID=2304625 RepID=A0A8H2JLK7_9GAMM|nr:FlgO family outer membrane protein [Colwellia ponticola]TMM43116.1 hypothetical protein FCS21_13375 [Colwellia ponticola]